MRGNLVKSSQNLGGTLIRAAATTGNTVKPHREMELGGMKVALGSESEETRFQSGAIGITAASITGLWHLSYEHVETFINHRGSSAASRFGPGMYVGAGEKDGTQIRQLKMHDHWRYELLFGGNVLLVPAENADFTSDELAENIAGGDDDLLDQLLRKSDSFRRINNILRGYLIEGVNYDAFITYSDPEMKVQSSEGVIINPEGTITVVDGHLVEGADPS